MLTVTLHRIIAPVIAIPADVQAMAQRGPDWADWVRTLPAVTRNLVDQWELRLDPGFPEGHGHCSFVLPVRTVDGRDLPGCPGPLTQAAADAFAQAYAERLDP